jgi:hypothetical protein
VEALVVPNGDDPVDFALQSTRQGYVEGVIRDQATGDPIWLAEAAIEGSETLQAAADGSGAYTLVEIPPGSYRLVASHPRYLPATVDVVVADGAGVTVDVVLQRRPLVGSHRGVVSNAANGQPIAGV